MSFRLVRKSVTLNDLMAVILCYFTEFGRFRAWAPAGFFPGGANSLSIPYPSIPFPTLPSLPLPLPLYFHPFPYPLFLYRVLLSPPLSFPAFPFLSLPSFPLPSPSFLSSLPLEVYPLKSS